MQLPVHPGSTSFPLPLSTSHLSTVCLTLLQPPAIFPPVYRPNMTLKQLTGYISHQGFKWWPLPFPSSRVTSPRVFPAPPGSHYSCEPLGFPLITYSLLLKSLHYRSLIPTRILEDWEESCPFCISKAYQQFNSVELLSHVWLFATPWTAVCQAFLSITYSRGLHSLMSIESVMPSNHLILCHPLFLQPSIFPSIRVFSNGSPLCIRWPKYWSFRFNISPSNEHPGLISFRMEWLDLFAVQGTLKSLLQHHRSKASIIWHSAFFIVQLSHPYMTVGKTVALTRWTFVDKVMSLLFNILSRLVITLLPRSKCLLISLLQSLSSVILGPKK